MENNAELPFLPNFHVRIYQNCTIALSAFQIAASLAGISFPGKRAIPLHQQTNTNQWKP